MLKKLHLDHLRVDLDLTRPQWTSCFEHGIQEAEELAVPIELALTFGGNPEKEWSGFTDQVRVSNTLRSQLDAITVFTSLCKATSNELLDYLVPKIRNEFSNISVGAGSNIYFTELNRFQFDYSKVDYVSYPLNPQVHAYDEKTLVENLEACTAIMTSAMRLAGDKPQRISPVTLRPRFNPDSDFNAISEGRKLPYDVDRRQPSDFSAAWTLGVLKYLSESGAKAITLYETHGMKGYLMGKEDARHDLFPTDKVVFPIYDLVKKIQGFKPKEIVRSVSSEPLAVDCLVLRNELAICIGIVNYTNVSQRITIEINSYELKGYEVLFLNTDYLHLLHST